MLAWAAWRLQLGRARNIDGQKKGPENPERTPEEEETRCPMAPPHNSVITASAATLDISWHRRPTIWQMGTCGSAAFSPQRWEEEEETSHH